MNFRISLSLICSHWYYKCISMFLVFCVCVGNRNSSSLDCVVSTFDWFISSAFKFFKFLNSIFILCVSVLLTCMSLQYMHASKTRRDVRSLGPGVKVDCELPCGSWELNPGPPVAQAVLLNDEPSLQPLISNSNQSLILGRDNGAY